MWIELLTQFYRQDTLSMVASNISRLLVAFGDENSIATGMLTNARDDIRRILTTPGAVYTTVLVNLRWLDRQSVSMINLDSVNALIQTYEDDDEFQDPDDIQHTREILSTVNNKCMAVYAMLA